MRTKLIYTPLLYKALLFFTWMTFVSSGLFAQSISQFHEATNTFLAKHVKEGRVAYATIADQSDELDRLIKMVQSVPTSSLSPKEQKAFWINAYNLSAISVVIKNHPITSVQRIEGFFDYIKHNISGEALTLNQLEEKLLLNFPDGRLHMALICAAKGCPPIAPFAYLPEELDRQLNEQTQKAIETPGFVEVDKEKNKVVLSRIFSWYEKDFDGGVLPFINKYLPAPIPADYKVGYSAYDWQLNSLEVIEDKKALFWNNQASRLLRTDEFEIKLFNSLYSQKQFDGFSRLNSRSTFFSSFLQYSYGLRPDLNIGFDLVFKSNVLNDFHNRSAFRALHFKTFQNFQTFPCNDAQANIGLSSNCHQSQDGTTLDSLQNSNGDFFQTQGRSGLAHIGPKFRFNPIKRIANLSLQQTLYLPVQKDLDGQYISFTQLFYDQPIGDNFQLFSEVSVWMPVSPEFRPDLFLKVFFSYFPTQRLTLYAMTTIPYEYGIGTKYFLTDRLEIELLYTYWAPIERYVNFTRPQTYNLGFRYRY